jgi:3-oxoacyl-[acyl-carrier protein] reductase
VIHIASIVSRMSFAGGGAYCASKHAVLGYSNALFEDVREAGVKVCAIQPGYVSTDMVAGRGLAMEKMIQPEDIAKTVTFVATYPDTGCPVEIIVRPQRAPF